MLKLIMCNGTLTHTEIIGSDHFPDGTALMYLKAPDNFRDAVTRADVHWYYEDDAELVRLIYLVGTLRSRNIHRITLFMPYIPNARQDRVKDCHDIFTLKYFADTINKLHFNIVTVVDPHSHVSEALFDRINVLSQKPFIMKAIDICKPDMLFFPDEGSMKRYHGMFDMKYTFGIKERDWRTGMITGLNVSGDVDSINGSNILIVDDICSRGGTFFHSSKKLKELGVKEINLYITHCENTILSGEVLNSDLINRVYTTDSLFTKEHEKIEVFNLL